MNWNKLPVLFDDFLDWYWPAFDAYSFILARMNEHEADQRETGLLCCNTSQ